MQRQQTLDLGRIDVLAAGDDHVLRAIDDVVQSLRIAARHVAAAIPTVAQHVGRRVGLLPVPGGDRGRADPQFARRAVRQSVTVGVGDPEFDEREGTAATLQRRFVVEVVFVRSQDRERSAAFGRTVELHEVARHLLDRALDEPE